MFFSLCVFSEFLKWSEMVPKEVFISSFLWNTAMQITLYPITDVYSNSNQCVCMLCLWVALFIKLETGLSLMESLPPFSSLGSDSSLHPKLIELTDEHWVGCVYSSSHWSASSIFHSACAASVVYIWYTSLCVYVYKLIHVYVSYNVCVCVCVYIYI